MIPFPKLFRASSLLQIIPSHRGKPLWFSFLRKIILFLWLTLDLSLCAMFVIKSFKIFSQIDSKILFII